MVICWLLTPGNEQKPEKSHLQLSFTESCYGVKWGPLACESVGNFSFCKVNYLGKHVKKKKEKDGGKWEEEDGQEGKNEKEKEGRKKMYEAYEELCQFPGF